MIEIKRKKDHIIQEGLAWNCIIMAGLFKLVNLVKRLFNKSDNKNGDVHVIKTALRMTRYKWKIIFVSHFNTKHL